ncbi:ABC transporter substrate-binding protein [Nocardioides astragali]|uniref:ABC transporter substrate-binding protein n=1 Tax=Nocardioides astragali TaxID=1776736 RepID=UPI00210DEF3A|nr:ABC transporter substrate-binding protein [Nocardioides astragali]
MGFGATIGFHPTRVGSRPLQFHPVMVVTHRTPAHAVWRRTYADQVAGALPACSLGACTRTEHSRTGGRTRTPRRRLAMLAVTRDRASGRRRTTWVVIAMCVALLTACGGEGNSSSSESAKSDTLTIALPGWTPESFDLPLNCSSPLFELAYEPLIRISESGDYAPGIAESWEYSEGNTVFTMTIREGVKFADGTDLTAQSVVDTLNYYKSTPGLNDGYLKPMTVKALGEGQVQVTYEEPFRGFESLFSSTQCNNGLVISAAGLKDPEKLKTDMFGAGPYIYVADESEPGDHYTFTPNPNYFEKSRQNWKKIVLRVIGDPNTAFNALATGEVQVDWTGGEALLAQAESKGFDVTEMAPWGAGIFVWDRDGEVSEPLADVRVRTAMALALDRENLAKAVGPATEPLDQFGLPGYVGADPDLPSKYTYDVEQAKKLMAEAGYADGFSVTMLVNSDDVESKNALIASVDQFAQIGVNVELKNAPETTFFTDIASKKYPLGAASWAILGDVPLNSNRLYKLPFSAVLNPFLSEDPDLEKAYAELQSADDATYEEAARQFNEVMTEKAWYIPLTYSPRFLYSKGVDIGESDANGNFDVPSWKPAD